jgi:hypothetical protein
MIRYVMKDYISSGPWAIGRSVIGLSSGCGNLLQRKQMKAGNRTMEDYQEELLEQSCTEPEELEADEDPTEL